MFGAGRPKRRSDSIDQAWEQWAASVNADNRPGHPRASPWQRIITSTLISLTLVTAVMAVTRAMRRYREEKGSGRIEFVDVDRPGAPVRVAR